MFDGRRVGRSTRKTGGLRSFQPSHCLLVVVLVLGENKHRSGGKDINNVTTQTGEWCEHNGNFISTTEMGAMRNTDVFDQMFIAPVTFC